MDSGGQGLMQVLKGCRMTAYLGKEDHVAPLKSRLAPRTTATADAAICMRSIQPDIKFGYCTEFIVMT